MNPNEASTAPGVDPGEGYRFLTTAERIESGDEFFAVGENQWREPHRSWIGKQWNPVINNVYRRRLAPQPPPAEAQPSGGRVEAALQAALRLAAGNYTDWPYAGGPDQCKHGYAAGIPCPKCDAEIVREALAKPSAEERG